MTLRYVKIALSVFLALFAIFYATQNMMNLEAAYAAVASVLGMEGHEWYTGHFGPPVTHPMLVGAALAIVITGEYAAGFFAAKGAWDMWAARKRGPAGFQAAKKNLLIGAGVGAIVWFGFFGALGGAYFQMWQTEMGGGALGGAFEYFASCVLVALFVNAPEPDGAGAVQGG
jgi:predicted small integral membrane protein